MKKPSEYPERIYLDSMYEDSPEGVFGSVHCYKPRGSHNIEYIRKDIKLEEEGCIFGHKFDFRLVSLCGQEKVEFVCIRCGCVKSEKEYREEVLK